MAKPVLTPTWATDATQTGGDHSGSAPQVPIPAGYRSQGFWAGYGVPARYVNKLLAEICDWIPYLRDLPTESGFVDEDFTWGGEHRFAQSIGYSPFIARTVAVDLLGGQGANWIITAAVPWLINAAPSIGDPYHKQLMLPNGATVTGFSAGIEQDSAGSSDDMKVEIMRYPISGSGYAAASTIATGGPDGVYGSETPWVGSVNTFTVDNVSNRYFLRVVPSDASGAVVQVRWASLAMNDPGPRNH